MQGYTVYFIWKLLYMFRVVPPPIIRSVNNFIYSICHTVAATFRYRWNWFECAVAHTFMHPLGVSNDKIKINANTIQGIILNSQLTF